MPVRSDTYDRYIVLCKELGEWIKSTGEIPNTNSYQTKSTKEIQLARFIIQQRRLKQGLNAGKWHSDYDKILADYGYPDLFDRKRNFGAKEDRCHKLMQFRLENGVYPSHKSEDEDEYHLAVWRSLMIRARTQKYEEPDKLLATSVFYDEYLTIAEDYGLPYAFHKGCNFYEKYTAFLEWFSEKREHPIYSGNHELIMMAKEFYKDSLNKDRRIIINTVMNDFYIDDRDSCVLLMDIPELRYHEFNKMAKDLFNFISINNRLPMKQIDSEAELHSSYEMWFRRISIAMHQIPHDLSRERMRQLGLVKGYKECMTRYLESITETMRQYDLLCLVPPIKGKAKIQIRKAIEYVSLNTYPHLYTVKEQNKYDRWERNMMASIEGNGRGPDWVPEVDVVLNRLGYSGFKVDVDN